MKKCQLIAMENICQSMPNMKKIDRHKKLWTWLVLLEFQVLTKVEPQIIIHCFASISNGFLASQQFKLEFDFIGERFLKCVAYALH